VNYDQLPGVRATHLRILARRSPLHFRYAELHEGDGSDDTTSRSYLRAVHAAILEPDAYRAGWAIYDDRRAGKAWDAWQAEHPGVQSLKQWEADRIENVRRIVVEHEGVASLLACSHACEVVRTWPEMRHGVVCKAKIDLLVEDREVWDLKTVADCTIPSIRSMIRRMRWDLQLAHYSAGVGQEGTIAGLICIEQSPPHDVACWRLPAEDLALAEELRQELLATIASCRRTGKYPGVCPGIEDLPLESGDGEMDVDDEDAEPETPPDIPF
jgi:hypothetical protein